MPERPSFDHELPLEPFELPTDLAEFLRTQEMACLMQSTSEGTAFVIKLPQHEIESVRGAVPVQLTHELISHPQAPVIRTVLRIFDQPEAPLALETVTNIASDDQARDFEVLGEQDHFAMLIYNEQLVHQLTKVVPQRPEPLVRRIVEYARQLRDAIPAEQYDFDAAKAEVLARRRL